MRNVIRKRQVQYLVNLLTDHIENLPDNLPMWLWRLKITYRLLVTLDNMDVFEYKDTDDVAMLDKFYNELKADFSQNSLYLPVDKRYFH